ncbi:MAG: O-antigen ligase family protein, partial [bacterium]
NSSEATFINLRAYLLALACYLFVRENLSSLSTTFLFTLIKYFLLCNGLLVVLQFITGGFYPAVYLAAGDPPLLIPSGFFDGPTKNGMLISFALSFIFAKFLWAQTRASYLDIVIFSVGIVSLVLSTSRAGIFSFCIVMLMGGIFAVVKRKRFRLNLKNISLIIFIFVISISAIYFAGFSLETLTEIRDPDIGNYASNVLIYKLTVTEGPSILQRYDTAHNALKMIVNSPLNLFSVGFGAGSYETLNEGFNIHDSYLEILNETGLYGFLAFLFLVIHVIRKAISRRDAVEILPVLLALMSGMTFMAFHDVLRGRTIWIPLAMLASFAYDKKHQERSALEL